MYYKDEKIEIRLGLGIKAFNSITADIYTFILSRINEDKSETVIETFTSDTLLSIYPSDGLYKIEVSHIDIISYYVFLNVNDNFIKEFVKQVKDVVCNCKCGGKCKDSELCRDNLNGNFAIKRQKIFNTTLIVTNTIKPFTYGQAAITNPPLFNFLQLFFNQNMVNNKAELGKEYYNYYIKGTVSNNAELFNSIIAGYYYAIYLYSKTLLLNNTDALLPSPSQEYLTIIDEVFEYNYIKNCLKCHIAGTDFIKIIQDAFINTDVTITTSDQNNITRVITIYSSNLSGEGTLEEQITTYINALNYNKTEIDSDIWINYVDNASPINCVVSDWSEWSECSIEGTQTRTRTVVTAPNTTGSACPVLFETRGCEYIPPIVPVDAVVSPFGEWSACTIEGTQTRTRTVITPASGGGITPNLVQTQNCIYNPPIDATVTAWSEWSICNINGSQTRIREIITPASNGGITPELSETRACTPEVDPPTPVDAIVSDWSAWSDCSIEGIRFRTRTIISPALNGGNTPSLYEEESCIYTFRTQVTQYYEDPCGAININVWLDANTNTYYTSEFGSTLFTGYLYDYVGPTGQALNEYEWQYMDITNGIDISPGSPFTTYSPCAPF